LVDGGKIYSYTGSLRNVTFIQDGQISDLLEALYDNGTLYKNLTSFDNDADEENLYFLYSNGTLTYPNGTFFMNGGVEGFNEWFESTMECHDMTANYTVTDADGSVYKYTCQFGETTNACHSISNMTENHEQERRFENITAEEMNLYLQKKFDGNTYVIVHT